MNQEQKSSQTQELIINTSFDLFYKSGYAMTTIPDIMKATCLSKGAFYHHFKNKQDIGQRVISDIVKKRIYNGMISPLKDYKQQKTTVLLTEIFTSRLNEFSEIEKQLGCPANNLINELGQTEKGYRILLRGIINLWKDSIIEVLNYAINTNQIKEHTNSEAVATFLIASFEGIRGIRKVYDTNEILEAYTSAIQTYISNLKK
jgi:AcrR family transcriptional regulator